MTTGDLSSTPGQTLAPPPNTHVHTHPSVLSTMYLSLADSFSLPGGQHEAVSLLQGHRGKQDIPPAPQPLSLGAFLPNGTAEHGLWMKQPQVLCCSERRAHCHPPRGYWVNAEFLDLNC